MDYDMQEVRGLDDRIVPCVYKLSTDSQLVG